MLAVPLFESIAHSSTEVVLVAYHGVLDELLGVRHIPSSRFTSAEAPVRIVTMDVICFDARAVTMAHNHPSGDPDPSVQDVRVTRRLVVALDALGVRFVDHLVLAGDAVTSFRVRGLL